MRKKTLQVTFTTLIIFIFQSAFSRPIDVQTAQKIAINFYKFNSNINSNTTTVARLAYTRTEIDNSVDYYVFDIYPKGFVIVAADDASEPILAYSNETFFDSNVPNTGIKDWMDDIAKNVNYLAKNNVPPTKEIFSAWSTYINGQNPIQVRSSSVAPMLKTSWNQSPYYNEYCPGGSVTGCVATAMAQIMKYWNYPVKGTGSYSYIDQPYGKLSVDFGTSIYSWNSMPNALTSSSTTAQKNAIANLIYQLGVSVATQYGTNGSGSWVLQSDDPGGPCAQYSYTNYFGYNSSTISGVKEASYTSATWTTMITNDLNAGRPIEYEGFGTDGGHTWVCDGYKADLFHMNWGWGGTDNGYYKVSNLNPNGIPLGSNNGAIFGIEPEKTGIINNGNPVTNSNSTTEQAVDLIEPPSIPETFDIYPVPASSMLTVKYSGSTFLTSNIVVANTFGQTISTYTSVSLNALYQLDISNYAPGIYFICITSADNRNRKVIRFYKE